MPEPLALAGHSIQKQRMPSSARHFAILAPPTPGHITPLQVLGAELLARGHRVSFVHLDAVARYVTDPQIGFAAVQERSADRLDAYLATLARPDGPGGLRRMIRDTAAMTQLLLDGAPAAIERIGGDVVIADSAEPAGALVARRLGLPHIVSVTGLPLLEEDGVPPPYLGWTYRPDRLGRIRNRGGYAVSRLLMRPITQVVAAQRRAWRLDTADAPRAYVAQCPRALDYPRAQLPPQFHYGGPWRVPESAELALPEDRPLIFCSLGSLQGSRRGLFAIMAEACAVIGARAVIGHGGGLSGEEEAGLPGDPLVRAFWPQQALLGRVAAAVLHGGFNTVLDALAVGTPIVCVPIAFEQPGTAARLARAGAAKVIPPARLTVSALVHALTDVLQQPRYRQSARHLAAAIAEAGGAAEAAGTINAVLADDS